ncbi:MAG: pyridoxamine 5'-phosphate oxidase [Rhodospirillaceae bacterium]|nr:pyridoxamine 5'-phosphate oxidase [Rhodospirillaceae bacterium]|tara:strand:+ start:101 stop:751 length:651 start_codon:yes stop_codon:yes gene_type:complete
MMAISKFDFSEFKEVIKTEDQLRAIMGEATTTVLNKSIDKLDNICTAFIAKSSFVIIASANSQGELDVSPKGDPKGFVRVLDEKHIAIPERPGNRRADTFRNLLDNPQVGLIFLVPGKGETLRVNGRAKIVRDKSLRESMAINNQVPDFATLIEIDEVFMHCPKCVVRSKIWEPEHWPGHAGIADIGEAVIAHAGLSIAPDQYEQLAIAEDRNKLY